MSSERTDTEPQETDERARWSVAFGWIAGACLGLMLSYGYFVWVGGMTMTAILTFVFFVVGAFGGSSIGDRLGASGFRTLGLAAGIGVASVLALLVAALIRTL